MKTSTQAVHVAVGLLVLVAACSKAPLPSANQAERGTFDRAAATARIDARVAASKEWGDHYDALLKREQAGEDVSNEKEALRTARPQFDDLVEDAEQIVAADPKDDAAFIAIEVALRGNELEDSSQWEGSTNQARQEHMEKLLLEHHIGRADFVRAVFLYFSQPEETIGFWRQVLERSPHRQVRAMAATSIMKRSAEQMSVSDLSAERRDALRAQVRDMADLIQRDYSDLKGFAQEAQLHAAALNYAAGATLPNVEAPRVAGGTDALASYRDKVVLVDFWATWCGACRKDHPKLIAFKQEMAGKPFEIISISVDETPALVMQYLAKEHNLSWPQWHVGPEGALLKEWGIQGYPTYLLVGGDGKLESRGSTMSLSDIMDHARKLVAQIEAQ